MRESHDTTPPERRLLESDCFKNTLLPLQNQSRLDRALRRLIRKLVGLTRVNTRLTGVKTSLMGCHK